MHLSLEQLLLASLLLWWHMSFNDLRSENRLAQISRLSVRAQSARRGIRLQRRARAIESRHVAYVGLVHSVITQPGLCVHGMTRGGGSGHQRWPNGVCWAVGAPDEEASARSNARGGAARYMYEGELTILRHIAPAAPPLAEAVGKYARARAHCPPAVRARG